VRATRSALDVYAGDITKQVMSSRSLSSTALCLFHSITHAQAFKYSRENKKCKNNKSGFLFIGLRQASEMAQGRGSCLSKNHPGTILSLVPQTYSVYEYRRSPRSSFFKLLASNLQVRNWSWLNES